MIKWILLMLLPFALHAAEPVVIRSSVAPLQAWKGQRVTFTIEVLGKDSWAKIPNIPALKIAGAYALAPDMQGVRLQEEIDGDQYTGQRYDISVYPQVGGKIVIDSFPVTIELSQWGAGKEAEKFTKNVPSVHFESKIPKGAEDVKWLVSTPSFSAVQQWSGESIDYKTGEAIKRKITLKAADVSGMAFQPIAFPPLTGVGIYPAQGQVKDSRDRGSLNGQREEEVTYIFESAGEVEIPAIEFVWWDLKNQQLKTVVLEGRKVTVTGGPTNLGEQESRGESAKNHAWWLYFVPFGALLFWRRKQYIARYKNWKLERSEHEKIYFKRYAEAANSSNTLEAQGALMRWLDRINTSDTPAQLGIFLEFYADRPVDISALLANSKQLLEVMTIARESWLKSQKVKAKADSLLPELNV